MLKKKIWANFQRIMELFTQKIGIKLLKIWVWDPGSGKNLFRILDPGIKKAPDPGSGSATLPIICGNGFISRLQFCIVIRKEQAVLFFLSIISFLQLK